MVLNSAIDMGIGLVPILGDIADVAWKANLRNLALLERHARPGVAPTRRRLRVRLRRDRPRRADCDRADRDHRLVVVEIPVGVSLPRAEYRGVQETF